MGTVSRRGLVVLALGLLGIAGCGRGESPPGPAEAPAIPVRVATVADQRVPVEVEAVGTVRARTTTVITSHERAYVVEVRVREGSRVAAGDLLVRLDPADAGARLGEAEAALAAAGHAHEAAIQAEAESRAREAEARAAVAEAQGGLEAARRAVAEAEAGLAAAETQAALAEATLGRYRQIYAERALSRQEYEEVQARAGTARAEADRARARVEGARAALRQSQARPERAAQSLEAVRAQGQALASRTRAAQARVREAEAGRERARVELGYTRLAAPGPGIVVAKSVEVGELAAPGKPLLTVDDPSSYRLEVQMASGDAGRTRVGQVVEARVDALGGEPFRGAVVEIVPAADPVTRTVTVKVELPPRPGLRSGLYGTVRVPVGETTARLAPAAAAIERGQLVSVYVIDDQAVARLRLVTLGRRFDDRVEVLSGLAAGESVVVEGADRLHDGARVKVAP
jgi:RND family efflux transporter MFP subunit